MTPESETPDEDRAPPARSDDTAPSDPEPEDLPIVVGIGSSAGGLKALEGVLAALPEHPGVAIVVVSHLDPTHESQLTTLLQRVTSLKVLEATQGMPVETDHVYVLPSNAMMTLEDGLLVLHDRSGTQDRLVHVVDRFFRSLASNCQDRSIGVVLSGTLADGTQGLREIKAAGGFALAQRPETAQFQEMPRSAIDAGLVDFVGSPDELGREVGRIRKRLDSHGAVSLAQEETESPPGQDLDEVIDVLRRRRGVDFSQYKRTTLNRRIHRRLVATGQGTFKDYARFLAGSDEEVRRLNEEILIHVTRFFREPDADRAVVEHVLPELLQDRQSDRPLRVWIPGCATGEEVYSIAIMFSEYLDELPGSIPLQIFATDLSESAIATAREGFYPETIQDDVSRERLVRFFERTGSGYQVRKHIRGMCIFATHNLVTDPPFSGMDLVSCRNVLIYMDSSLQRRVLSTLHYALHPSGFLVLGSSETVGVSKDLFSPHEAFNHVFRKRDVEPSPVYDFTGRVLQDKTAEHRSHPRGWGESEIEQAADRVLLEHYAPPGVVVNKDFRVIHFKGRTIPYLQHRSGPANLDLMRMVPEKLATAILHLVKEAQEKETTVSRQAISMQVNGKTESITLEVTPVYGPAEHEAYYLVTFLDDHSDRSRKDPAINRPLIRLPLFGAKAKSEAEERIKTLNSELASTREHLKFVTEDYEATMEELRSANEEAISTNEELQSTNEELETTKEELVSTNEELSSLNDELHQRNQEIQKINNDVINLLNSVGYPIVMLGADLVIRRFTSQAREFFNLKETDVGRPFSDIQPPFESPRLKPLVVDVLEKFTPSSIVVDDPQGKTWTLRFHPYRTLDHKIDGVVIVAVEGKQGTLGSAQDD